MTDVEKQLECRVAFLERKMAEVLEKIGADVNPMDRYRFDDAIEQAARGNYTPLKELDPKCIPTIEDGRIK